MKKQLSYYVVFWLALVSLFNIVCFIAPNELSGLNKFGGSFWPGYIFIMVSFVGHLVFSFVIESENNREKRILNYPLIIISYLELAVMIVAGSLCMVIPDMPIWSGIIICYVILAISVILLISAKVVGEKTSNANLVLNKNTYQFREFTDRAHNMVASSENAEIKLILQEVYDALRYSDPISSNSTSLEEMEIDRLLSEIDSLVGSEDKEKIETKAKELKSFIILRNNKCKALKRQRILSER